MSNNDLAMLLSFASINVQLKKILLLIMLKLVYAKCTVLKILLLNLDNANNTKQ